MEKVIELLEIHKDEEGASKNLSLIKNIYAAIKDSGVTELTNESLDVNAIIKGIEDNADAIQRDIITLDTSYTDENGVTQSYKNVDDYNAAREDAIGKIDEYWDYAHGDYLAELNNYANAVDESYTNRPAYISVENYEKETVEDFKDNYIFNNSYDEKEIKTFVNNAKTEQANIQNGSSVAEQKAAYDNANATLSNYETSARNAVNAANNFEFVKQDNTTTTPAIENPENDDPINNDPINDDPINDNPEITYTDATITDISQVTDWTKVGNITLIASPDANGSLDVISYYNLKKAIDDKVASLSDGHSRTVAFADYPATVKSFKISMPSDKTNVELMNSIVNPKELEFSGIDSNSTVAEREAKIKKTEVIPGVNLVSYPAEYEFFGYAYNHIQQAFEFTGEVKNKNGEIIDNVISFENTPYDLMESYHSGLIGSSKNFSNLGSVQMSGRLYKEDAPYVYSNFVLSQNSKQNLPNISVSAVDIVEPGDYNLYGSQIDKIIEFYASSDALDKISYNHGSAFVFDAIDYLNGGVMYQENAYTNSSYDLDANAALLMAEVANVNIIGKNKLGITESDIRLINTRIEADMGGVEFTSTVRGVLDIAGTQSGTLTLPELRGRLIVRDGAVSSENSSISLYGGQQIDLSEVSEEDVSKIYTRGSFYNYLNFKNENATTKTNVGATGGTFYGTENRFGGVSAQQAVEAANRGDNIDSLIS